MYLCDNAGQFLVQALTGFLQFKFMVISFPNIEKEEEKIKIETNKILGTFSKAGLQIRA